MDVKGAARLTDHEVHDAVSDEEDGDVSRDVLLVSDGCHEPVLHDVVKEVHAEERGDARGVQGEVPAVLGHAQQAHEVVHEHASEHVQTEEVEIRGAESDVVREELGELIHLEKNERDLSRA